MNGLFAGLTAVDIQNFTDVFPCSDEKPICDLPLVLPGGPATNAAVAFARLGGNITLLSAVVESGFRAFVSDDLGAGDIFHGAFCYYYLKNSDFCDSLCRASAIAGHSCLFPGTRSWLNNPTTDLIIGKNA